MLTGGHRAITFICLIPMVLLAGCVDFEKETMVFVFQPGGSEIRGLLIYEGIGVSSTKQSALKEAKEQFTRFVRDEAEFCLGDNWILHFMMKADTSDDPDVKKFKAVLRNSVVVNNGALFRNNDGKLSGYQTITVRDGRKLFEELNVLISAGLAEMAAEGLAEGAAANKFLDANSLRMIEKAAKENFRWFNFEPGRLSFTMPVTPAAVRKFKNEMLKELASVRKDVAELTEPRKEDEPNLERLTRRDKVLGRLDDFGLLARLATEAPVSFQQSHDRIMISLGLGNAEPIQLHVADRDSVEREKEIVELAESLKVPFRDNISTDKLVDAFIKDKGVLPRP